MNTRLHWLSILSLIGNDWFIYGKCSKICEHFSLSILDYNVGYLGRSSKNAWYISKQGPNACQNSKQGRPWSDCFFGSSLIWVCAVCLGLFAATSVQNFRIFTVLYLPLIFGKTGFSKQRWPRSNCSQFDWVDTVFFFYGRLSSGSPTVLNISFCLTLLLSYQTVWDWVRGLQKLADQDWQGLPVWIMLNMTYIR